MAAKKQWISEEEIRECAIRLMEHAGTLNGGWAYRDLRDYEDEVSSILRGMIAGEYRQEES